MKHIREYGGIRVFEGIFSLLVVSVVYSIVEGCFLTSLVLFSLLYFTSNIIKIKTAKLVKSDGKFVLITGCDSGFGHGLAKYLHELGFNVLATCLNEESSGGMELKEVKSDRLKVITMDVGQDDSVLQCQQKVEQLCGNKGLWGVVNNAGINFLGDVEMCTMKQYQVINNVNLLGMVRVTKSFLPLLRLTKGRVVNVTSVKGRLALPCNSVYGITKFGGEAFSDSLRQEMKRFGIKVSVIQPGNFGGITGCLNKEGVERIKRDMDDMWLNTDEEVKQTYGRHYHDALFTAAVSAADTTSPTIQPVLDAFKDALLNETPQTRYLVSGGKQLFDPYIVLAYLVSFLPSFLHDKLILKKFMTGLPVLQALQGKHKTN